MSGFRSASHTCRRIGLLLICLWMPVSTPAQEPLTDPIPEARLKAAFLYNLPQFIQWPDGADPQADAATLRIGVLDNSALGSAFSALAEARPDDAPLTLVTIRSPRDAETCHMLFLNGPDTHLIRRLLQHVATRPILTVGEDPAFIGWGGMLRFVRLEDRLRLEASPRNARRAGLRLGAQLLEVCHQVESDPPPPAGSAHLEVAP